SWRREVGADASVRAARNPRPAAESRESHGGCAGNVEAASCRLGIESRPRVSERAQESRLTCSRARTRAELDDPASRSINHARARKPITTCAAVPESKPTEMQFLTSDFGVQFPNFGNVDCSDSPSSARL